MLRSGDPENAVPAGVRTTEQVRARLLVAPDGYGASLRGDLAQLGGAAGLLGGLRRRRSSLPGLGRNKGRVPEKQIHDLIVAQR